MIGTRLYRGFGKSIFSPFMRLPCPVARGNPRTFQALSVLTEAGTTTIEGFNGFWKCRNEGEPPEGIWSSMEPRVVLALLIRRLLGSASALSETNEVCVTA